MALNNNLIVKVKITDTKEYKKIMKEIEIEYAKLKQENKTLRRALELACQDVGIVKVITKPVQIKDTNELQDYYINQVKKEINND